MDTTGLDELMKKMKAKKQKAWMESLMLIIDVQNGVKHEKGVVPLLLDKALKMKFDFRQTYIICQYLIEWGYAVEPYLLLSKFARQPGHFGRLYKQYIKLGFYLRLYENEREQKKIKMALNTLAQHFPKEFCDLFKWDEMGIRALEHKDVRKLFCEKCLESQP